MKKYLVDCLLMLMLLAFAACLQNHHSGVVAVSGAECVDCHLADYNRANTLEPDHAQNEKQCGNCHTEVNWHDENPHPEARFPIATSAHMNIDCTNCHNANLNGGKHHAGADTDCINTACHVQADIDPDHNPRPGYAWNSAKHNFCLTCHPSGEAKSHPEAEFPIARSNHSGIACAKCHSIPNTPFAGGQNVSCVESNCHPRSDIDPEHRGKPNYTWDTSNKQFCRNSGCHPTGRKP